MWSPPLSQCLAIFHPCQCTSLSLPPITLPFHPVLSCALFTIYLLKLMNVESSPLSMPCNFSSMLMHFSITPSYCLTFSSSFISCFIYHLSSQINECGVLPSLNALQFFIHVNALHYHSFLLHYTFHPVLSCALFTIYLVFFPLKLSQINGCGALPSVNAFQFFIHVNHFLTL